MELPKTPIVDVQTTNNRGFTPEEIAARCVDKIVEVGDNAAPEIRDHARAFKSHLEKLLVIYMKMAIKSDRTTICAELQKQGHAELANIIRKL